MKKNKSETSFKEDFQEDIKKNFPECYCLKTAERSRRGVPDILMCLHGKFIGIELKKDGEVPTKLQDLQLTKIARAGGISFAATPSSWPAQLEMLRGLK